jgi:hypothetical protein
MKTITKLEERTELNLVRLILYDGMCSENIPGD